MSNPASNTRYETRQLLMLTLPIMATQLAQIGMGTVDTVMSGYISTRDLAAVAIGTSLWMPAWLFLAGILVALSPLVSGLAAQSEQPHQCNRLPPLLGAALWVGIATAIVSALGLNAASMLIPMLVDDAQTANIASRYLMAIAVGFPAIGVFLAFRFYAEAMNQATHVTRIMLSGLALNIPANGLFVYGWFGLPELGGVGCGIGSSLVFLYMAIAMAWDTRTFRLPAATPLLHFTRSPDWALVKKIYIIGVPIGLAIFFEVSLFSVVALFLTKFGPAIVAGHQVAINVSSMTFMVPLSLGMALTVRVGHYIGKDQVSIARQVSWMGVRLNLAIGVINALLMTTFAATIAALYSPDPEVIAVGASLLLYAAIFQLSDATQVSCAGALRGFQDTFAVMVVTFIAYWGLGLGSGYWLAFHGLAEFGLEPMGAEGLWTGLIIGLSGAAVALIVRLRYISQKHSA